MAPVVRQAAIVAAISGIAAGCCPPLPPGHPSLAAPAPASAVVTPAPHARPALTSRPRSIPAPVLGRFQQRQPAVRPVDEAPVRETITEPPHALPGPKVEEVPVTREPLVPPKPAPPADLLPDEVVLRLLETGRAVFVRCFKKAIAADPTQLSFKVRLHVELDEAGTITVARSDATNPTLDACLSRSVRWLKFPATGRPAAAELPLFYRE